MEVWCAKRPNDSTDSAKVKKAWRWAAFCPRTVSPEPFSFAYTQKNGLKLPIPITILEAVRRALKEKQRNAGK